MKMILTIILAFAFVARAASQNGSAVEYHFGKSYALVAATDLRIFIELRTYDRDQPMDSVVLSSRYMPPEFEAKDVAFNDGPEFIVRTRDGGTGLAVTHLAVYGIVGQHIQRFGDFVVERQAESWPDFKYEEKLSGNVTFPKRTNCCIATLKFSPRMAKPLRIQ